MDRTAADVQREIEELRKETTLLVSELEARARDATSVKSQVQHHPAIAAGAGIAMLGGLAFSGYAVYERVKDERKPRIAVLPPEGRGGKIRETAGKEAGKVLPMQIKERGNDTMLKRVLFAALTAAAVTLATFMARRMVSTVWKKTMQETSPGEPKTIR